MCTRYLSYNEKFVHSKIDKMISGIEIFRRSRFLSRSAKFPTVPRYEINTSSSAQKMRIFPFVYRCKMIYLKIILLNACCGSLLCIVNIVCIRQTIYLLLFTLVICV